MGFTTAFAKITDAENWRHTLCVSMSVLVFVAAVSIQFTRIEKFMPYPQHIDERHLTDRAANILKTGDYNPHFLEWPSFPIYLTTVSMAVGYLYAASELEVGRTADIGSVSFPYFTHPKILWAPKILFVLLGLIAAFVMGAVGYRLTNNPYLLFLGPLVILLSRFFSIELLAYPNVDTVGVFSVACLYLFLFSTEAERFSMRRAVAAGALTGMTVASKYSLFLVFVPTLFLISTQRTGRRFVPAVIVIAVAIVTFVVLVPFSVLDLPQFLDDLAYQANHYYGGHPGLETSPGIPQLRHYLKGLRGDFGLATLPFFVIGMVTLFRTKPRQTLAFVSFPALHLLFFSLKPVHFTRNIVFIYVCYALFAAVGVTVLPRLTKWALRETKAFGSTRAEFASLAIFVVAVFIACFPVEAAWKLATLEPDARNRAHEWILENVARGDHLVVPKELQMDLRALSTAYEISSPTISKMNREEFDAALRKAGAGYAILPVFGVSSRGSVRPELWSWAKRVNSYSEDLIVEHHIDGKRSVIDWGYKWTPTSPEIRIVRIPEGEPATTQSPSDDVPTE
jgi:hypothetical protein